MRLSTFDPALVVRQCKRKSKVCSSKTPQANWSLLDPKGHWVHSEGNWNPWMSTGFWVLNISKESTLLKQTSLSTSYAFQPAQITQSKLVGGHSLLRVWENTKKLEIWTILSPPILTAFFFFFLMQESQTRGRSRDQYGKIFYSKTWGYFF